MSIKRILIFLLLLPFIAVAGLYATGNGFFVNAMNRTYLKGHATANINDAEAFNTATIKTASPELLEKDSRYDQATLDPELVKQLKKYDTAAFLIVKDGKIINEQYFKHYNDRSKTNSFSMAKTVVTMLIGIAIEEGIIKSLDQAVSDFIPEFADDPIGKDATIAQLSLMNSGYEWTEHYYSWFSPTVELYHGSDIEDFLVNREFSAEPGTFWEYSSASTQLLGIVLKRALAKAGHDISLSEYLSEKIWQPLHMNDDAVWHTDNQGMELVFCCINSNARNFAKLGMLMLQNGEWKDKQIIPASFVKKMIQPDGQSFYGYSTWLNYENETPFYLFSGHLGQYTVVIPEHNMVLVRLGERRNPNKDHLAKAVPEFISYALKLVEDSK